MPPRPVFRNDRVAPPLPRFEHSHGVVDDGRLVLSTEGVEGPVTEHDGPGNVAVVARGQANAGEGHVVDDGFWSGWARENGDVAGQHGGQLDFGVVVGALLEVVEDGVEIALVAAAVGRGGGELGHQMLEDGVVGGDDQKAGVEEGHANDSGDGGLTRAQLVDIGHDLHVGVQVDNAAVLGHVEDLHLGEDEVEASVKVGVGVDDRPNELDGPASLAQDVSFGHGRRLGDQRDHGQLRLVLLQAVAQHRCSCREAGTVACSAGVDESHDGTSVGVVETFSVVVFFAGWCLGVVATRYN